MLLDPAVILLFVKAPMKGQVKTRLASAIGVDAALELYRNFVLDILDSIEKSGYPCVICYTPSDSGDAVAGWLGRHRRYMPQEGMDLGARMSHAFASIFSRGTARAILVGSDVPDLSPDILRDAFEALQTSDAVIGPAQDGGYYLIGFRSETYQPDVFRGIPWSTDAVLEETIRKLESFRRSVHRLPKWRDVDTIEDLRDLMERTAGTECTLSRARNRLKYLDGVELSS